LRISTIVPIGARRNLAPVHQPARAGEADAHAGRRFIATSEDLVEVRDARTAVGDANQQDLRRALALDFVRDAAVARIADRVARDLRHCGGDPRLILSVEAEHAGDLSRLLPRDHEVLLADQRHPVDHRAHRAPASLRSTASRGVVADSAHDREKSSPRLPAGW
jgi:hypothetical protein